MENGTFKPYVGPEQQIPEFTIKAILLGILLAIVLGAANTYLGLYAGMTVSASIPAAVISMGILRGILRRGTILENNMVQTIASTGESLAAGIIFTLPALVIAGIWTQFDYWTVTLIAIFGGVLGILFMIPMRKSLIVEEKMLKYPEGTACAEVLKVGEGSKTGMATVAMGVIMGGCVKFLISGVALFKGTLEFATRASSSLFYFGTDISAALVGVGAIVGLNIAVLMFVGGAIAWLIGIPILGFSENLEASEDILETAWVLWSTKIRYMGVGAMVIAGLWSIINIRHGIVSGFKEIFSAYEKRAGKSVSRTELNMKTGHIFAIMGLVGIAMVIFYQMNLGSVSITVVSFFLIMILSFFLVAVASYICGLVGSSNSPVSGMTICALLFTSLILYLMGTQGTFAIMATLMIAGVVCCATCTAGDISQDLKTGHLLGATPRKQQWAEIIGALTPAFIFAPILALLHNAYGIGTGAPGALKAPQAALFASLTQAIFGDKSMPWTMLIAGMILAIVFIVLDTILKKRGAGFRLYSMPVAVGIYLPLSLSIPILAGGLIEYGIRKKFRKDRKKEGKGKHGLILLSSGIIAGEALMGILIALGIWIIGSTQTTFSLPVKLPFSSCTMTTITLIGAALVLFIIVRTGLKSARREE